ncbi:MAG: flagellar export chaperone FliS [bacterium]|nr:flagellar export chaperone FliS [bacterium]
MALNAAALYRNASIQTASPADIILKLLEGAIKFENRALVAFEKNDIAEVNTNLIKTQKIISELRASLDHKYPVAKDFEKVYSHISDLLVVGNMRKEAELVEQALTYTREMRDTWKEVMEITKTKR